MCTVTRQTVASEAWNGGKIRSFFPDPRSLFEPSKNEEKQPQVGGRCKLLGAGEIVPGIVRATPEQLLGLKAKKAETSSSGR